VRRLAAVTAAACLAPASAAAQAPPAPVEGALYEDAPSGMYLLKDGWTTRADPNDVGLRRAWHRPGRDAGFRATRVPHAFNARDLSRRSFRGRVQWYRVRFTKPEAALATAWRIRFESVNNGATVWLNGARLGAHRTPYLPFELTARGLRDGANELVVRVDSRPRPRDIQPAGRERGWWNFGGILHEVYLREIRTHELRDLRVQATATDPARVTVSAAVAGPGSTTADLRVTGPDAFLHTERVEADGRLSASFVIPQPRLWSPASPALYRLAIRLANGQEHTVQFGVREWGVDASGRALLNGRPLNLRGASFHEQTRLRGAALTDDDREDLLGGLRDLGADFARQHYPPHPALLEAFDREGIVFWAQVPVWRWRGTQMRAAHFRDTALRYLARMVLRDRNHASVMAWSVSNETLRGGAGETSYLRAARNLTRRLDPTRLLAADKALRPLADIPARYRLLDAIGINEYLGWYSGRTSELGRDIAALRRRFPREALFVTEFGAEANRDGSGRGTYSFQRRYMTDHLKIIDASPHVSGALAWVLRDFAVRPGWTGGNPRPGPPILYKGLLSQSGQPKPAFAAVRDAFARRP